MKHGVALFVTDDGLAPDELARLAEALGFESLFFPEHTHIPAERRSPFFPRDIGDEPPEELPDYYPRTLDPFIALTAAACATERLLLGTGVCLMVERDPIVTAKAIASLDQLSGGRFLFGVGAGWNREEMENHGTDPRTRMRLLAERVKAMKAIWTEEEATFHGDFVNFDRIWSWPKPARQPHPPVLVGGHGPTVLERVLDFGDEWLVPEPAPQMYEKIAELQVRAREAGRSEGVPVTMFSVEPEDIPACQAAGVHRCVHWLPARDPEGARAQIHALAQQLLTDSGD